MKGRKKSAKEPKKRTTISVADELMEKAAARMRELSRPSFTNYVEFLIAQDTKEPIAA